MTDKVAQVLRDAADLIEPKGKWTQGAYGDRDTCMCAKGAVYAACYWEDEEVSDEALNLIYSILPKVPAPLDRLVAFNDAPCRTQAEVVAKLREAAALAEEQAL